MDLVDPGEKHAAPVERGPQIPSDIEIGQPFVERPSSDPAGEIVEDLARFAEVKAEAVFGEAAAQPAHVAEQLVLVEKAAGGGSPPVSAASRRAR